MGKVIRRVGLLCLMASLCGASARAEFFFDVMFGATLTQNSDLQIKQPGAGTDLTLGGVHYDGEPFQPPPYYGVRLGYFIDGMDYLGFDVEYMHFKIVADTDALVDANGTYLGVPASGQVPMKTYVGDFEISNGLNFFSFNVLARQGFMKNDRVPQGRVQAYVGAGLAAVRLRPDMFLQGAGGDMKMADVWDGPGYNTFIGARIFPTDFWQDPDLNIFAEYRFTYIDADIPAPLGGSASLPVATHHFIMGLGVSF